MEMYQQHVRTSFTDGDVALVLTINHLVRCTSCQKRGVALVLRFKHLVVRRVVNGGLTISTLLLDVSLTGA